MFWTKRVVIGDGERGLVYRNRQFERALGAGVRFSRKAVPPAAPGRPR